MQTTVTKQAITVRYTMNPGQTYVFRYNPNRQSASVAYPNGHTHSETRDGDVPDEDSFQDYCAQTIGEDFVGNLLSIFNYQFRKNIRLGSTDFSLDAGVLTSMCMSDQEQRDARKEAQRISNIFEKEYGKGGLNLEEFEDAVIGRHRPDVTMHLTRLAKYIDNI